MEELEAQLRPEAYRVHVVAPGIGELQSFAPDLILVDASDPEQDALTIMRRLPRTGTPLLLLAGAYTDRLVAEALEAGADGCLPAQTSARELAAWVRAILRRRALPAFVRSAPFQLGTLTIDLARGQIEKQGVLLLLPPTPLLLLRTLAERPGQVVPREHLLTQVLGPRPRRKMSTLHVHMFTLRTIIEDDPRHPRYVKTVRGIGYVLSEEEEARGRCLPSHED
jgi:DNA-binding response OmpR family regulator